jgi:hypothetical protein
MRTTWLLAMVLAAGCAPECPPGTRPPCTCDDGRTGTRTCRDDGTPRACSCLACAPGEFRQCDGGGAQQCGPGGVWSACQ